MSESTDGKRPAMREAETEPTPAGPLDQELRIQPNPLLRYLYLALGLLALALAVLGAILPGLPTTVWLIVATYFFVRSSGRLYALVMNHRLFGPLIRDFRAGRGIPARARILAISMIVIFAGGNSLLFIRPLWLKALVLALGATGIIFLLRLPTSRKRPAS